MFPPTREGSLAFHSNSLGSAFSGSYIHKTTIYKIKCVHISLHFGQISFLVVEKYNYKNVLFLKFQMSQLKKSKLVCCFFLILFYF